MSYSEERQYSSRRAPEAEEDTEGTASEVSDHEDVSHARHAAVETPGGGGGGAAGGASVKEATGLVLPVGRIKRIMQKEQSVKAVAGDATFLIAKAAEMFMEGLASRSAAMLSKGGRASVNYNDVACSVAEWAPASFLRDIVPKRMSAVELVQLQRAASSMQGQGAPAKRRKKSAPEKGPQGL
mmetsp:Transcript_13751/g.34592  ORF Transcript_13751/g.34592 Transcript_13751/m.34592 type:complete len:183 (-) Transcript_13751:114-662(-)